MAWPAIIAGASALGSLGVSLFGGGNDNISEIPYYDVSADLERIKQAYSGVTEATTSALEGQMQGMTQNTANQLAKRGIYSSPVSEYSFNQLARTKQNALASALANVELNKANALSSAIGQGADYNQRIKLANLGLAQNQYDRDLQNRQAIARALSGISGAMLPYAM